LAMRHSDRALALNPNFVNAMVSRGFLEAYTGKPALGADILVKAFALDPHRPDYDYELLAESYYLMRDYERAVEIYARWRNPPPHMYAQLAACHAQLGHLDEARAAVETFHEKRPKDSDFDFYAAAHARLCLRPEDAEHWMDGYRKAGLLRKTSSA
ncbi:MAG: CDC27 family protein, partial [Pseudomonadota bacterium]